MKYGDPNSCPDCVKCRGGILICNSCMIMLSCMKHEKEAKAEAMKNEVLGTTEDGSKKNLVIEIGEDGLSIHTTIHDLDKADLNIYDMWDKDLCHIGRDDDSHEAVTKLLKALKIEYAEV